MSCLPGCAAKRPLRPLPGEPGETRRQLFLRRNSMRFIKTTPAAGVAAMTALLLWSGLPARPADPGVLGAAVSPSDAKKVSDAKLELKVRDRLLTEVRSDAVPIRVVAMDGTVILSGEMGSRA